MPKDEQKTDALKVTPLCAFCTGKIEPPDTGTVSGRNYLVHANRDTCLRVLDRKLKSLGKGKP